MAIILDTNRITCDTGTITLDAIYSASEAGRIISGSVLNNPGTGYAINDTFTVNGGSPLAKGKVLTVGAGGAVLTYILETPGDTYSVGAGINTTKITGSGTGLTLDITAVSKRGIQKIGRVFIFPYALRFTGDSNFAMASTSALAGDVMNMQYSHTNRVYFFEFVSSGYLRIGSEAATQADNRGGVVSTRGMGGTNNKRFYASGDVQIYNTQINRIDYMYIYGNSAKRAKIVQTTFIAMSFGLSTNEYTDVYDSFVIGGTYATNISSNTGVIDGLVCARSIRGLLCAGVTSIIKNVKVINTQTSDTYVRAGNTALRNVYLVDCLIDKEKMSFYISGTTANTYTHQSLQSTFDFIVNDEVGLLDGVSIKIYDKDDNLVLDGVSSAGLLEEIITYYKKTMQASGGVQVGSIMTVDYEPFKIVFSKDGFETGVIENYTVTSGAKSIINITLKTQVPLITTPNDVFVKKNPQNIGDNRGLAV